jgi:hypothetical protein
VAGTVYRHIIVKAIRKGARLVAMLTLFFAILVGSPANTDATPAKGPEKAKVTACCCHCPPNPLCPQAPTCCK